LEKPYNNPQFYRIAPLKKGENYFGTTGLEGSEFGVAAGAGTAWPLCCAGATVGRVELDKTPDSTGFLVPNQVIPRVLTKKITAQMAVVRDRKLAEPEAPNRLPEDPDPNAAPISAPLPCWINTKPMIANAEITCKTTNKVLSHSILFLHK
jgi:hypothetical protein